MKKLLGYLVMSSIIILALAVAGCGGGGGGGGATAAHVAYFTVEDQGGSALQGVSFRYSDPTGQTLNTNPSSGTGQFSVTMTKPGRSDILGVSYLGTYYPAVTNFYFITTQDQISNNGSAYWKIVINTSTGAFFVSQL